jgi:hypothetical protein
MIGPGDTMVFPTPETFEGEAELCGGHRQAWQ